MEQNNNTYLNTSVSFPMSEKKAKEMFEIYNKMFSKSKTPIVKDAWKFWEENLDFFVEDFTKKYNKALTGDKNW